jgi:signal peptidase I
MKQEVKEDKKVDPVKEILSWVLYIGCIIVLTYVILHYVGQRTVVSGPSMNDTLQDGDNLIVDKLSYRFGDVDRFDIIVFEFQGSDTYYIKRVIGLPNETVQIVGDNIYINGELLEENYGKEPMESAGIAAEPITLGDDEYFVLGDNRNDSTDSRTIEVGKVPRDYIVGRAFVRIWPFSTFGLLKHE